MRLVPEKAPACVISATDVKEGVLLNITWGKDSFHVPLTPEEMNSLGGWLVWMSEQLSREAE